MIEYLKKSFETIRLLDPHIANAIEKEFDRQQNNIELIASENLVSGAVLATAGSILTNKYAEGYPSKRYYGGCEFIDAAESLAIERAKKLFGAEAANVQPHSGAQANSAVYYAALEYGDTVMGMILSEGGHLTHGSKANSSGRFYNFVPYGVNHETGMIDYDEVESIAKKCLPKLIVCGASAYPRNIDFARFRKIADSVGAMLMVDMAHIAGLVAAGMHQNPIPYAEFVTTTTHKTLRGPRGGMILCRKEFENKINKAIFPGTQGGPLEHIIAAKAVCFKEAMGDKFRSYISSVIENCAAMANHFLSRGIKLVSGGTDNHLLLLDLSETQITGKELETNLDSVRITVNKNTIPGEKLSPNVASGIRIGTATISSRGMDESDAKNIAELIYLVYNDFAGNSEFVKSKVLELTRKYPIYV